MRVCAIYWRFIDNQQSTGHPQTCAIQTEMFQEEGETSCTAKAFFDIIRKSEGSRGNGRLSLRGRAEAGAASRDGTVLTDRRTFAFLH